MAKRTCPRRGCNFPSAPNRQLCGWHWLLDQPAHIQEDAATRRREAYLRTGKEIRSRVPKSEWPDGARWCSGCQSFVPDIYVQGSRCRACNSKASHGSMLVATYGITREQYDRLWSWQGGRCYVCQKEPKTVRLAVDHDHSDGHVRGLLCAGDKWGCNHAVFGIVQNLEIATRVYAYLEKNPVQRMLDGEAPVRIEKKR